MSDRGDFVYVQNRPRCESCGAHVWHWWDCDRPDKPEYAKRNTRNLMEAIDE